jgi:hypothetical protein
LAAKSVSITSVGRLRGELGEEIELRDRGGDQVDSVEAIAEAIDFQRIMGRRAGQVERGGHVT